MSLGNYRRFGTTYRSHIQGSSSPVLQCRLVVSDVSRLPIAPIFKRQAVLLHSVAWYFPTFRDNLSFTYSRVKQPCYTVSLGNYRHFGTTYRSHIQGSSSPVTQCRLVTTGVSVQPVAPISRASSPVSHCRLVVSDVTGLPIAPIFKGQQPCYTVQPGSQLPTFRDNLSLPYSRFKQPCYTVSLGSYRRFGTTCRSHIQGSTALLHSAAW